MGLETADNGSSRLPINKTLPAVAGQVYFAEDKSKNGYARIYFDNEDGKRITVNSLSAIYDSSEHKITDYYLTYPTLTLNYGEGKYFISFPNGAGAKKEYHLSDIYPTTWTWANGNSTGPTASIKLLRNGLDYGTISVAAIPTASENISGIMTTGNQTFAGEKTFNNKLTAGTGSSSGTALQVSGNANITYTLSFNSSAHMQYDSTDECLYFTF